MGRPSLPVREEGRPSLLIKASKKRKDYLRKEIFGGGLFSMQGKVEICGVNTAKLPVLREEAVPARAASDIAIMRRHCFG